MNTFLSAMSMRNPTWPGSLHTLRNEYGVTLILTRPADPDGVGYVPYRPVFYVEESPDGTRLLNMLNLLDEFFAHLQQTEEFQEALAVTFQPHAGINLGAFEAQELTHTTMTVRAADLDLGLKIFEAYPPNGQAEARHLVRATIQIESADTMAIVFTGRTFPFRERFEAAGVGGTQMGEPGMENRPYLRIVEAVNVADAVVRAHIKHIFGAGVLKCAATMVVVEDEIPPEPSPVRAFIDELRSMPSLHFV